MTNNRPSDEATAGRQRRETLLPDALRRELPPPLYATDRFASIDDAIVRVRLFTPYFFGTSWTWYVADIEGEDVLGGLVKTPGSMPWYARFSLRLLETIEHYEGIRVERDPDFQPVRLGDLAAALSAREG